MLDVQELLEAALERQKLPSYRQLSLRLGLSAGSVHHFQKHGIIPSEDTAIRLAEMAGRDPQMVVIELRELKAESAPARAIWSQVKRSLKQSAAALPLLAYIAVTAPGEARAYIGEPNGGILHNPSIVYIMRQTMVRERRGNTHPSRLWPLLRVGASPAPCYAAFQKLTCPRQSRRHAWCQKLGGKNVSCALFEPVPCISKKGRGFCCYELLQGVRQAQKGSNRAGNN